MKRCELCGTDNPDEARFCMKCGKDLDAVTIPEAPDEIVDTEAFIPAGASEEAPIGGRLKKIPAEETETPKPIIPETMHEDHTYSPEIDETGTPEIQLLDVAADFTSRQVACPRCGTVNPYEQQYCKNCGSALGKAKSREADRVFESATEEPQKSNIEITTLTDMTPSISQPASDYYATEQVVKPRIRKASFAGGLADWGVKEWLILIVLTSIIALCIWFFLFGGKTLFSGKTRNLKKVVSTMKGLPSFQLTLSGQLDSSQTGEFGCSGVLTCETPNRAASDISVNFPGREPIFIRQIRVENRPFVLTSGAWQPQEKIASKLDPNNLWAKFSNVEDVGTEIVGQSSCHHYQYRVDTEYVTGFFGIWHPEGSSDAIMDIWFDAKTFRVVKMKALVVNVPFENLRVRITLSLDLTAIGQQYNIQAPF